jgi:hypothetical protein
LMRSSGAPVMLMVISAYRDLCAPPHSRYRDAAK